MTGHPVEVRKATGRDLAALLPLFDAYRRFYRQQSDTKGAASFLKSRLAKRDSVIFLAWDGKKPCGFLQLYPSFSSVSMKRLWILNDIFISPASRRNGVAQALIGRAIRHAKETGSKGLVLETGIDNMSAQALYESLGWKKENKFRRYFVNL